MREVTGVNGTPRTSRLHPADKVAAQLIDVQLEAEILGSCLIRPHLMLDADVAEHDFASEAHRTIWRAMLQLHADGEPLDTTRLRSHLLDRGQLEQVGGLDYLLALTNTVIPTAPLPTARLRRLTILRRTRRLAEQLALHAADHEAVLRYTREIEKARTEYEALGRKVGELETHRLDPLWKTVGERGSLAKTPPPRRWLLQRPDDETNGMANPIGVLPMGKTGLFIAQGGAGKTMALIQLAIAVATGRKWLDHFLVPRPGRVLLALAEEDGEELDRRLYELSSAMRLTDAQRREVEKNVVALGLSGEVTALVAQDGTQTLETDVLQYFRRRLEEGEWSLIVLDTLARFAGGDTEKDNAQATRFIQAAGSLCKAPGRPTVLIAHHTNKTSRVEGATTSAANARGASGLTDGARWVCNLETSGDEGAKLTVTKSNYALCGPAVMLTRDAAQGGCLRIESPDVARQRAQEHAQKTHGAVHERILDELRAQPGLSKNRLRAVLGMRRDPVYEAVDELVVRGLVLEQPKNAYRVAPIQGGEP
jgi:hypothetical protein